MSRGVQEQNLRVVERLFRKFNEGSLPAVFDLFHPDVEVVPLRAALEGNSYRGIDGLRQFDHDARESFPSMRVDTEELRAVGDKVLVRGRLHGLGRDTGAPVVADLAWVVVFEAQKVIRLATYTDHGKALEAAGLTE